MQLRLYRIHQTPDGLFETRNEFPKDRPLGVDSSLNMAMRTAHREAVVASRAGAVVVIEAQRNGEWQEIDRVPAIPTDKTNPEPAPGDSFFRCPTCGQMVDRGELGDMVRHQVPGHKPIDKS
ncbi:MAG: hypothetical protein H0U98_07390 [Alphaproteobacteria bacterium]|nr:hypothetical protein [Alphaproteobacteria bacterium]